MGMDSVESEEQNSSANVNFLNIMAFLEELESLLTSNQNSRDIKQKIEAILDQVRTKLNEQVKAFIRKKIQAQHLTKYDKKIVPEDQKNNLDDNKQAFHNKDNQSVVKTNPNGTELKKSTSFDKEWYKC